ncbi:MAG: hypothetical protein U1F35_05390 [Steroidobacteraceae bacterium]
MRSALDASDAAPPVIQIIPDLGPLAAINTAATTDIVAAPGSSTERNVEQLTVFNASTTVSNAITVQVTDGTNTTPLWQGTLLPGEQVTLDQVGVWTHYDASGSPYIYTPPARPNLGISGTLAESMPRETCPEVNSTIPSASGTLFMQAIYLTAGQVINNIILSSATTAAGTPTHYIAGIYTSALALVANTADQTSTAWAANTVKTIALTAAYRVPTSGLYYIGFFMTATTIITMKGGTARTGGQLAGTAPIVAGTSSTGLTTALPGTAAALTSSTASLYAAVS